MINRKGIWFYGISGSGKSYASNLLKKEIEKSIIIDGDVIRKYISYDLGYSIRDREIQINRILGIGKIIIESNNFPLISSVWMNKEVFNDCKQCGIEVIKIDTDIKKLIKDHKTYENKKNVVGIDINYNNILKTKTIYNNKDQEFWTVLKRLII